MKKTLFALAAMAALSGSAAAGWSRRSVDKDVRGHELRLDGPFMFQDALGLLSDAQAFSATGFSTNTIDLGNVTPKNEIGNGEPMCLCFTVDTGADFTTTDETYRFDLVQSANANLSSPDVLVSLTVSAASSGLVAGKQIVVPVPPGLVTKRYLGAQMTLGGTTPSITVTCALVPQSMVDKRKDYANGYTVS
jgi:hypothetical protein